ncbi:MAG: isoprenylcysteine carboxylmethyltransferase family protein [Paracoccaceae bacterium]|nr:isoprenylcysteine carboxylmethyltransferase family protein [Paracoccaceae bacterium]
MSLLAKLNLPPVWLIGFIGLAWVIAKAWAPLGAGFAWAGWGLIGAALILFAWAVIQFRRAGTTIVPGEAPSALVEGGPFRLSRNPIYLADLLILAGIALILGAPLALLLIVPFQQVLVRLFILPEETILERDLRAPYLAYKARVRRWL